MFVIVSPISWYSAYVRIMPNGACVRISRTTSRTNTSRLSAMSGAALGHTHEQMNAEFARMCAAHRDTHVRGGCTTHALA